MRSLRNIGEHHLDAGVFTGKLIGEIAAVLEDRQTNGRCFSKSSLFNLSPATPARKRVEISRITASEDGDGEAWQTRNVRCLRRDSPDVHLHLVLRSGEGPIERGKATETAVEREVAADERLLPRLFSGNRQEARSDQNQTAGISAATEWR